MIHAMKPRDIHREIADERDRLRAEIERLTRENGELRKTIMANAQDAERQVATLREALEPFANQADNSIWNITPGMMRAAAAALAKEPQK